MGSDVSKLFPIIRGVLMGPGGSGREWEGGKVLEGSAMSKISYVIYSGAVHS